MPIETGVISDIPKVFDIDGARKAGISEDQILGALRGKFGKIYNYDGALKAGISPQQINDAVSAKINNPVGNWDILKQGLSDARDKIIDLVKPPLDSAATIGGAALGSAAGPVGSFAAGAASGIGTDALLQKLQSQVAQNKNRTTLADVTGAPKGSLAETGVNAIQNEGVNELLGKVFNTVGSKVKGLIAPETPLESLKPTFSQTGSGDKSGLFSSLIENIWSPNAKKAALDQSSQIAREKFGNLIEGPKPLNPADRFNIGRLNNQFESGKATVEDIGRSNTIQVPQKPDVPVTSAAQFEALKQNPQTVSVEGPVYLNRTADEAKALLAQKEMESKAGDFTGYTDTDKKLIQTAQQIVENTDGGTKPIPFKTAITLLHGEGGNAGIEQVSSLKPGEVSPTKDILGNIADSLHRDIQDSLAGWRGGSQALDSYNTARAAALTKQTLAEGGTVQKLVESANSPIPSIDKALQNPSQTQKLLNTSNIEGVKSNNMAQDLRGYRLQQIWNKADSGTGTVNGDTLVKEWNNPAYAVTKDQLFSKQAQSQIGEFFDNVRKVTQEGRGAEYGKIRMTMRGLEVGSGILTGVLSGNLSHAFLASAGFAGLELPPYALSKIFTNPARAAVLNRLVTGAPLEMSTQQAGRLIMGGLNGVTVSLVGNNGEKKDVVVRDGRVQ